MRHYENRSRERDWQIRDFAVHFGRRERRILSVCYTAFSKEGEMIIDIRGKDAIIHGPLFYVRFVGREHHYSC